MKNPPLISVVVTSYNHAEYLERRMSSLLCQSYKNMEIIVVDDCSDDNSVDVLRKYDKYENVSLVFLKKNHGYAYASNLGVELSNGEYIMFAECDDFSEKNQIKTLMKYILFDKSVCVVFSNSNMVDENGCKYGEDIQWRSRVFRKICKKNVLLKSNLMQHFFLESCVIPNMSAAIIKKETFNFVDGLSKEYKLSADWDMWCRLSEITDFYYVTTPLNNFRNHRETVRSKVLEKKLGVIQQMSEIIILLHNHLNRMEHNVLDRVRLHSWIAITWAQFLVASPRNWVKSFISVANLFYDRTKLWPLYLIYGIFYRFSLSIISLYKNNLGFKQSKL